VSHERNYYTVRQLAELLDVGASTVRAWVARGTAPKSHKVGGERRFLVADVHSWCAERGIPLPAANAPDNDEPARR
jgi:excisionase family DNA binding protein